MKKTFFTLFLALCTFSCAMFSQKTAAEKTIVATYNKGQITLAEAQLELEKIASKSEKLKDIKFSDLKKDQQELIIKEMPSPTLLLLKCSMDCDIMRENN